LRPNVWHEGQVALLDELYVVPALRGQGIGSAVLDRAEAIARQRGAEMLEINVDGQDADARRFYERHGFTPVGRERTAELLRAYWTIPERQIETSVVLARPPY